jgi:hypothetical protein
LTNPDLIEARATTSWLWEYLRIEVGEILLPFHVIGDAEGCICGPGVTQEYREKAKKGMKAKSAARKVQDWLVNGDSGLKSLIQHENVCTVKEFSNENLAEYMNKLGHYATAFMMTRKQLRALIAAPDSLINTSEQEAPKRPTMFGRDIIVNDYIDYKAQDIWGLNLWEGGLKLLETEAGMRKEPDGERVLWDIDITCKFPTDVTVMRQA